MTVVRRLLPLFAVSLGLIPSTVFSQTPVVQSPVDHIVMFGDSLSDNGNLYAVIQWPYPPIYSLGRSTDGPDSYPASAISGVWVEQLAATQGISNAQPDLVTGSGLNFAFSGAETGAIANSASGPYGMAPQVQKYLQPVPANIGTALHVFLGGNNDVFDYANAPAEAQTAITNISGQISQVAAAGGKYFVWLNMSPLQLSPRGAGRADLAQATAAFANSMQDAITTLHATYPNIVIVSIDTYSLYKQVIASPATYGLTNVTTSSQGLAVNPDQYLWWDDIHPTTRMHQIIANLAQNDLARGLGLVYATPRAAVADEFTAAGLDPAVWTVEASPDATVAVANGHAVLSLPGAVNHDAFMGGDRAVRILQPVSNTDLDVAAKFDTSLTASYEGQGIMVQQNDRTYLRCEAWSDGTLNYVTAFTVSNGTQTSLFNVPLAAVAGGSVWLEVKRTGDTWLVNSSTDGVNYTPAGTFAAPMVVTAVGPYAWNYNSNEASSPALTSQVDWFHNLSQ